MKLQNFGEKFLKGLLSVERAVLYKQILASKARQRKWFYILVDMQVYAWIKMESMHQNMSNNSFSFICQKTEHLLVLEELDRCSHD